MSYALPKERNALIEARYAQLIEDYGDDMDVVQDIIEAYIRKLDSKTIESEPTMFAYVKNRYSKCTEKIKTVPLTEDLSVRMVGIEYPDINLVTAQTIIKLLSLTEKEFVTTYLYFFDDKTYSQIAKKYKVTTERIRQICCKALRKLRHPSRSRFLKASAEYFELGLSYDILSDVIDNFIKIYSFNKDFDNNIVTMDDNQISTRLAKIFGNTKTADCFTKVYCNNRKIRMKHLSESAENVKPYSSAQPLILTSDAEYLEIIDELETAINNLKRYKYFPYKLYIDTLLEGIYKIRDKMAKDNLFELKCIFLYIIRKISKFRINMLNDNIKTIVDIMQEDLHIETEDVLFRNIPLGYIYKVCDNMLKNKEIEEINNTFKLIGIENPEILPVSALFSGLFLKSDLLKYFGSFYYTLRDYIADRQTIVLAKGQVELVSKTNAEHYDTYCFNKISLLKQEKEKIKQEEQAEKKRKEKEWEKKRSYSFDNICKSDVEVDCSANKDEIISGIKDGSISLNETSVYNVLYCLSIEYHCMKYTEFIILNPNYIKSIINKVLARLKDGTFKSIKLNEIDPYMPLKTWTELYYMFRTEPVSSRIQNNLDLHYWIIIDLFVIIVDYIGL